LVPVVFFVVNSCENEIWKLQLQNFQRLAKPVETIFINAKSVSHADIAKVVQYATQFKIKNYYWQQIEHRGIFGVFSEVFI
jgi:hypothetical protein